MATDLEIYKDLSLTDRSSSRVSDVFSVDIPKSSHTSDIVSDVASEQLIDLERLSGPLKISIGKPQTEPEHKLFEIKPAGDKGLGMFALQNLSPGEVLLAERPLIRLLRLTWIKSLVEETYAQLELEEKDAYMALHSIHGLIEPEFYDSNNNYHEMQDPIKRSRRKSMYKARRKDCKSVMSIWFANCMSAGTHDGVFKEASRINHSCVPNSVYTWNSIKELQEVRAVKPIMAGEEITITYCDSSLYTKSQRAEPLLRNYNFECRCVACLDAEDPTTFAAQSHQRRYQLSHLADQNSATQELQIMHRTEEINLMEAEGLVNPKLGFNYSFLSSLYEEQEQISDAIRLARRAVEIFEICWGNDAPMTMSALQMLKRLKAL